MQTRGAYAGRTAEQRRAERRQRLIDAGFDLAGRDGVAAVKVRALCEHASLNDRYFYEHFRTVDELLAAILEDQAAALVGTVLNAIVAAPEGMRQRVECVVEACLDYVTGDPRRGRLIVESQSTQALREKRGELIELMTSMFVDQTRELLGDDIADDRMTHLAAHTVTAGVADLVANWITGRVDVGRDELAEFVIAMILASREITGILERERALSAHDR